MKQAFTTVLFLFVTQYGWSQLEMKLKPRLSLQNADIFTERKLSYFNPNSQIINPDSSRLSQRIAAGSVYILPQDNMPCLKPDTTLIYNMPAQTGAGNGSIPNAYQPSQNELLQSLRKQFQKR